MKNHFILILNLPLAKTIWFINKTHCTKNHFVSIKGRVF